jgi:predicted amidophosphoribosyltransferase
MRKCPFCNEKVQDLDSWCSHCGKSLVEAQGSVGLTVKGKTATVIVHPLVGLGLIAIGAVLSLTGIGAIIGIPLIIFAIVMIATTPLTVAMMKFRKCPVCGTTIEFPKGSQGVNCPGCKKRFVNKKGELFLVE